MKGRYEEIRAKVNELLLSFLSASTDSEADCILTKLITEQVEPIIRAIIRSKLRSAVFIDCLAEDLHNEILLRLLKQLRELRTTPGRRRLRSFSDYVAVVARNSCNEHLRRLNPMRQQLKKHLHYLLSHHETFAIWRNEKAWMCGHKLGQTEQTKTKVQMRSRIINKPESSISQQLGLIFSQLDTPILFEDAVDFFWAIQHARPEKSSRRKLEELPDSGVDATLVIAQTEFLKSVWSEIKKLSLNQRRALLLGCRDVHGEGVLWIFPLTGIANMKRLSEALQVSDVQLTEWWNELPLDDRNIAQLLGVTRQQVINLRKSARKRLARRLKSA